MPELGKKHECSECGAKFYDMGKPAPVCPRCDTPVAEEEEQAKPKVRRKPKKEVVEEKAVLVDSGAEADVEPDTGKDSDLDDEDLADEEFAGLDDEDLEDLEDEEEEDFDDEDDDLI